MIRRVEAELLDELAPDDPGAVGSRRDIRRLNAVMGNARVLARALQQAFPEAQPIRLVELGAGDGFFAASVLKRMGSGWRGGELVLVDRLNAIRPEACRMIEQFGWRVSRVTADARQWLTHSDATTCDAVVTNLFLHQFEKTQIVELLSGIVRATKLFVALEPRRTGLGVVASRLAWLMGCNRVTLHDAPISVRAGFAGDELSKLWPAMNDWALRERRAGLFSHLFVAHRNDSEHDRR
jgi:hypothetical protein